MVVMELLVVRQWSQYFHYVFVVQYLSLQQILSKLRDRERGGRERERGRERGQRERERKREREGRREHKKLISLHIV